MEVESVATLASGAHSLAAEGVYHELGGCDIHLVGMSLRRGR